MNTNYNNGVSAYMETVPDYPADVLKSCFDAKYKAEGKGVYSLSEDEKNAYSLWLYNHLHRINEKGKNIDVIHPYVVDLILCENRLFALNRVIYIYNPETGCYLPDRDGKRIKGLIESHIDKNFVKANTIKQIYELFFNRPELSILSDQVNNRPAHWIHFRDCYFDVKTGKTHAHDPKYNEISLIPYDFMAADIAERRMIAPADHKCVTLSAGMLTDTINKPLLFNDWLDQAIPDFYDQKMLLEYIGYAMTLDTSEQKFLLLVGQGGTGKSTLLKLIEEILGATNTSNITLQGLQDRFTPAELFLKQANICSDIPLTALNEVDMIKRLTGEDTIVVERKYCDPFSFRSGARLFFSANDVPYIAEKSNAFYRRMMIIKMDNRPDEIDLTLFEKLRAEIPHIITRAVSAIYENDGQVDVSPSSAALVKIARKDSDTVEAFLCDKCETGEKFHIGRADLYSHYANYCDNEMRQKLTKRIFFRELEKRGFTVRRTKSTFEIFGIRLATVISISPDMVAAK